MIRDLLRVALLRGIALPVSGAASIWTARIVFDVTGPRGFAAYAILIALPALIPLSDFGLAAAITDSIAQDGVGSNRARLAFKCVTSILAGVGLLSGLGGAVLAFVGLWGRILGIGDVASVNVAAAAVAFAFGLQICFGAGQRALLGMGRQSTAVLLTVGGSVVAFALVIGLESIGIRTVAAYVAAFALGPVVAQLASWVVALRALRAARSSELVSGPGAVVRLRAVFATVALPMAVISLALPAAYQLDRVFLSHLSGAEAVAQYSVVALLYFPLASVLQTAAQTLWPAFMKLQGDSPRVFRLLRRSELVFAGLGVVSALALTFVGPFINKVVSSDAVFVPTGLYASFGLLLIVMGVLQPPGMLLMDAVGRRFQAVGSVAVLGLKVMLSLLVVPLYGPVGSVLVTAAALAIGLGAPVLLRLHAVVRESELVRDRST